MKKLSIIFGVIGAACLIASCTTGSASEESVHQAAPDLSANDLSLRDVIAMNFYNYYVTQCWNSEADAAKMSYDKAEGFLAERARRFANVSGAQ